MLRRVRFTSSVLLKNNRTSGPAKSQKQTFARLRVVSHRSRLPHLLHRLVELNGIEPMTSCLQSRRSPN